MSDEIERTIKRDLDRLPVLPETRWLPPSPQAGTGRKSPRAAATTSLAATIVSVGVLIATVIFAVLANAPRESAASPSPVPSAARYGLIVQSGDGPVIRREDDSTQIAALYVDPPHRGVTGLPVSYAVSPDGGRVLYWAQVGLPSGGIGPAVLGLYDATTGSNRELLRLSDGVGAGVIWSTDGSAALFGVSRTTTGTSVPTFAFLRAVDIATGQTTDVGPGFGALPASGGPFFPSASPRPTPSPDASVLVRPMWWDRQADRVVALLAGPNVNYVREIVVIDHGVVYGEGIDGVEFVMSSLTISPDGKRLAGIRTKDLAAVVWPTGNYAQRDEVVPAAGESILSLWWRPRSDEVFFRRDNGLDLRSGTTQWAHLEVWRPGRDSPRVVDSSAGPWIIFRFDGSAYFSARGQSLVPSWDVVDSDSGQVTGRIGDAQIVGSLRLP